LGRRAIEGSEQGKGIKPERVLGRVGLLPQSAWNTALPKKSLRVQGASTKEGSGVYKEGMQCIAREEASIPIIGKKIGLDTS
jgi:hypothetical protein